MPASIEIVEEPSHVDAECALSIKFMPYIFISRRRQVAEEGRHLLRLCSGWGLLVSFPPYRQVTYALRRAHANGNFPNLLRLRCRTTVSRLSALYVDRRAKS